MKLLPLAVGFISLTFNACMHVSGNSTTGEYSMTSLGADLDDYAQTSNGVVAAKVKTSDSFREGASVVKHGFWATAFESIAGKASEGLTSVAKAKQVTAREGLRTSATTEQLKLNNEVRKLEILNPVEEIQP